MKETAPLWSMRGRSSYEHKEAFPGPGTYSPTNSMMHTSPNYRVGTAPRKGLAELTITPGPGAYSPPISTDTPHWTILGKTSKSSTFQSVDTPGPGAYRVTQTQESPRYSVGKGTRNSLKSLNQFPGPGSYNPQLLGFRGNNIFGKSERSAMVNKANIPGPGGYETKSFIVEGPRYSFRPRIKDKDPYAVPGPGRYHPNHSAVLDKAPVWGTKTTDRNHDNSPVKSNPGPGTYINQSTLAGPKWGFGSSKRGRSAPESNPGPGTYEVKSCIGATPSYVQVANK